jgi:hypothetical protein
MNYIHAFQRNHKAFQKWVHTSFRYELDEKGQFAMKCVYFTTPIVGGWYLMDYCESVRVGYYGEQNEKLDKDREYLGGRSGQNKETGEAFTVGGEGAPMPWNVRLVASNKVEQKRNKDNLKIFLDRLNPNQDSSDDSEGSSPTSQAVVAVEREEDKAKRRQRERIERRELAKKRL